MHILAQERELTRPAVHDTTILEVGWRVPFRDKACAISSMKDFQLDAWVMKAVEVKSEAGLGEELWAVVRVVSDSAGGAKIKCKILEKAEQG